MVQSKRATDSITDREAHHNDREDAHQQQGAGAQDHPQVDRGAEQEDGGLGNYAGAELRRDDDGYPDRGPKDPGQPCPRRIASTRLSTYGCPSSRTSSLLRIP